MTEIIKILPHHACSYFEFYYLGRDPDKHHQWYGSQVMRDESVKRVQAVLSNADQLIQLVSQYDDWCGFCPYHKEGENYDSNKEPCARPPVGENGGEVHFAKTLGLIEVLDKDPITSKQFFEMMKPTYERLIAEPLDMDKGIYKSLRQLFRYYALPKTFEDIRLPETNDQIIKSLKELSEEYKILWDIGDKKWQK